MRHFTALLLAVAAVAPVAAFATPAAAAPQLLAREQAPFTASAFRDAVAWSAYDPQTNRYRLRLRRDGAVTTPAIADRGTAFDVDLGRLVSGTIGAVFSRCADDTAGTGCDLYLYDLDAGTERRLTSVSSPTRSEILPSLDGGRVAFARLRGERTSIFSGQIDGEPGSVRHPTPREGSAEDVELSAGRLFYHWADRTRTEFGRESLFRVRGGTAVRMFATESGGANTSNFAGLSYTGRYVYFAETNLGSGKGNRLYRATTGGGRLQEATGSAALVSADWIGDRFVTAKAFTQEDCLRNLNDPPEASLCVLEVTDATQWKPAAKLP